MEARYRVGRGPRLGLVRDHTSDSALGKRTYRFDSTVQHSGTLLGLLEYRQGCSQRAYIVSLCIYSSFLKDSIERFSGPAGVPRSQSVIYTWLSPSLFNVANLHDKISKPPRLSRCLTYSVHLQRPSVLSLTVTSVETEVLAVFQPTTSLYRQLHAQLSHSPTFAIPPSPFAAPPVIRTPTALCAIRIITAADVKTVKN